MNVRDLINKLMDFPPDYVVLLQNGNDLEWNFRVEPYTLGFRDIHHPKVSDLSYTFLSTCNCLIISNS